jgi:uncharacterized protein YmfQ (DUF2313 family)
MAIEHGVTSPQKFGMKFHTREQAEKAKAQMKQSNLLRYWVSTLQELGDGNCKIVYSPETEQYEIECDDYYQSPSEVYMTINTAKKIRQALNNGELEL